LIERCLISGKKGSRKCHCGRGYAEHQDKEISENPREVTAEIPLGYRQNHMTAKHAHTFALDKNRKSANRHFTAFKELKPDQQTMNQKETNRGSNYAAL
jgi:hypothetical protein